MSTLTNPTPIYPQQGCRLTTLPPELRSRIYAEVFGVESTSYGSLRLSSTRHGPYSSSFGPPPTYNRRKISVLALLETCRFIYPEAETVFYSKENIEIGEPLPRFARNNEPASHYWAWVESLSVSRLTAIEEMTVHVTGPSQASAVMRFLRMLPTLRKITLVVQPDVAAFPVNRQRTYSYDAVISDDLAVNVVLLGHRWPEAREWGRDRNYGRWRLLYGASEEYQDIEAVGLEDDERFEHGLRF